MSSEFETPKERDMRLARQIEEAQARTSREEGGVIRLFMCPNCSSYYGASTMGDLEKIENRDIKGNAVSTRARCPMCGTQRVERYARLIPQDEVDRARKTAIADLKKRVKETNE